jgi:hypothetical protein
MRRGVFALVAVVGCAYNEPMVGDDMSGSNPGSGSNPARTCPSDPTLKLCVDFDGSLTPTVADGAGHTISSVNVVGMNRSGDPAAHVDATSQLTIASAATGDLDLPQLTLELWISPDRQPPSEQKYSIFDHSGHYSIEMKDNGSVTCSAGGQSVDSSTSISTGAWTHVACTFDSQNLNIYVSGNLDGCQNGGSGSGSTGQPAGVAIGAELGSGFTLDNQFIGGIDNVWLYDHALTSAEVCAAAGGTACRSTCPG